MNNSFFKGSTILGIFLFGLFAFTLQSVFADTTIQTGDSTNSVSIQNEANKNVLNIQCQCTPTPTSSVVQNVPSPTSAAAAQAVATPTTAAAVQAVATPTPTSIPAVAPSQSVLGVSTMAPTGTFMDNIMDVVAGIGIAMLLAGLLSMAYKKGFSFEFELQY